MATIENDILRVGVNELGAELCEIHSKISGKEFMWDANPDIWGSYAPVLFPVIGAIKDGYVLIKGQQYKVPDTVLSEIIPMSNLLSKLKTA